MDADGAVTVQPETALERRHVVVIGAGGNIGSHLVPHLARMPEVGRLTLIDRDTYVEHNVRNQAIDASRVGRKKAADQARVARRINPSLDVSAIAEHVEDVPLGLLRGDLIVTCLDSRRSRQHVNEAAWRLAVPWLDAGVLADGLLARVELFVPAPNAPCMECSWSTDDYAALEQTYPCAHTEPAPSTAPSSLGALAASLQALECGKVLTADGGSGALSAGDQVVVSAMHYRLLRTAHRRNPDCRLGSHDTWNVEPLALARGALNLAGLFHGIAQRVGSRDDVFIRVPGKSFVTELVCESCGNTRRTLRLLTAGGIGAVSCERCTAPMAVAGFAMTEQLEAGALSRDDLGRPLRALGIRPHEIITAHSASGTAQMHFELLVAPQRRRVERKGLEHVGTQQ